MEIKTINEKNMIALRNEVNQEIMGYMDFRITSQEKLETAVIVRKKFLQIRKMIEAKEKEAIDPLKKSIDVIKSWFLPLKTAISEADARYYSEMASWEQKKRKEAEAKAKELEQEIQAGKVSLEQASKKIEKSEEKVNAIPTREITKVRITDFAKLSDEYKIANEVKIKADLLADKKVVGAELYKETIIVNK